MLPAVAKAMPLAQSMPFKLHSRPARHTSAAATAAIGIVASAGMWPLLRRMLRRMWLRPASDAAAACGRCCGGCCGSAAAATAARGIAIAAAGASGEGGWSEGAVCHGSAMLQGSNCNVAVVGWAAENLDASEIEA